MRNRDKFRGSLVAGAAGDALGYAVEFSSEEKIAEKYGSSGITEYRLTDGLARISDDTQMTLFTAAGLLLGTTVARTKGIVGSFPRYIAMCYRDWLATQQGPYPAAGVAKHTWLLNVPELFSPRAPGNTCLSALMGGTAGTVNKPLNSSKGCGGVMRVAPIGLYFCDRDTDILHSDMIAAEAAAITHGHDLGWMPAAALAHIIRRICEDDAAIDEAVTDSLKAMGELFPRSRHLYFFTSLMKRAMDLAGKDTEPLRAIHKLGEGWVAEETLAIAVYCALKYPEDMDRALIASVNHKGDSDSTGAVTGNILGAKLGFSHIPDKYRKDLELHDLIVDIADDLWKDCPLNGRNTDEIWERKYVRMTYTGKGKRTDIDKDNTDN